MEKDINFLKEYEGICKKYGIQISAGFCCSSCPYLENGVVDDYGIDDIHFVESENKIRFTYWNDDKTMYDIDIERLEELIKEGK